MISDHLDPGLLRTFVAVCRHGSLSRAAYHTGRAQSALSMQMRRLEDLVGKQLLRRTGRGVVPTSEGELMLGYATRILALGEEAVSSLAAQQMAGSVRIGLAEEIAITALPAALGHLRRSFPDLHLDVSIDHSGAVARRFAEGELDLAIATSSAFADDPTERWNVELLWVAANDAVADPAKPLDIITYGEPCAWRRRMQDALTEASRTYRVTLTSQSISAIRSAVSHGLGVALMTSECIDITTMKVLTKADGVPETLCVQYGLYLANKPTPIAKEVSGFLLQATRAALHFACQE